MAPFLQHLSRSASLQFLGVNAVFVVLWRGLFAPVACPEDVVVLPRETYNLLLDGAIRSVDGGCNGVVCNGDNCQGFHPPIKDDVPGTGDIMNGPADSLQDCATQCNANPNCKAFEYSPTARGSSVNACQLVSTSGPLAGGPYGDFMLWIKDVASCSTTCKHCAGAPAAAGGAPALPAAAGAPRGDECDIDEITFDSDPRFAAQINNVKAGFSTPGVPTFEELYMAIINRPYTEADSIWTTLRNPYNMQASMKFPFSNLGPNDVNLVIDVLGHKPQMMVEVGSFHGNSALTQLQVIESRGWSDIPLLCIDPWSGDLGMLLFRDDWEKKLTPGELVDGRSTSYWQFMLNIQDHIKRGVIGAKHVVPLVASSTVGGRYLLALGIQTDLVYLDSAHERDETYIEMKLFWTTLRPGGVLFGDDYGWTQVKHDVDKFVQKNKVKLELHGGTWHIQKPA